MLSFTKKSAHACICDRICENVPNFTLFGNKLVLYILGGEQVFNKIPLFYRPSSFCCEDRATDKQPVNKIIVEKLRSKIDFLLFEQYSVFLRKSVNVIMSFNNLHAVTVQIRGFPVYVSS